MSDLGHVPQWAYGLYFVSPAASTVLESVRARWDIDGVLPFPRRGWLRCPICKSRNLRLRSWKFHSFRQAEKKWPYRCDVSFKCQTCSLTWVHGVATPQGMNEHWGLHTHVTDKEALAGKKPPEEDGKLDELRERIGQWKSN